MKHTIIKLRQEFLRHLGDYLFLLTAGILFVIALSIFKGERLLEFIMLLLFVSLYILWGIYHHIARNDLHLRIVLEYILIGFTVLYLLKILILPT